MDSKTRAAMLNVLIGFTLGAVFVSFFNGKPAEVSGARARVPATERRSTQSTRSRADVLGPACVDASARQAVARPARIARERLRP